MSIHRTYNVRLRLDSHLHNRVTKVGLCIVPGSRTRRCLQSPSPQSPTTRTLHCDIERYICRRVACIEVSESTIVPCTCGEYERLMHRCTRDNYNRTIRGSTVAMVGERMGRRV